VPKQCSRCESPAELSLCFLLSTVGRANRLQKCSRGTLLCNRCMRGLLTSLARVTPRGVQSRLVEAYTTISDTFAPRSDLAISCSRVSVGGKEDARG
jgi:hypothetical protein